MTADQPTKLRKLARMHTAAAVLSSLVALAGASAVGALADGPAAGAHRGPRASAARTVSMSEYANLRLTRSDEATSTLYERGHASGTFPGTVVSHLTLSPGHVDAVFTLYPKGGSVTGRASARFIVRGSTGYYGGTLRIVKGTGAYRRASGSNIGISGTINRVTFALMVKASGVVKY